ncbi:MAG: DNA mismatch repair protein MutT [Chloroflexota bacterium]|nr:MAG: DNA mismatch repair protein MutT [Chloroflexota bacterium]
MADISFKTGLYTFNYRVAALIEHQERYLFTTTPEIDFWFLPGGRVKAGESALEAIARELQEELGITAQSPQLLWTVENFFTLGGERYHEVSFYFAVSPGPEIDFMGQESFSRDSAWEFRWFDLAAIQALDVRPPFLKWKLAQMGQGLSHIIFRQEEQRTR